MLVFIDIYVYCVVILGKLRHASCSRRKIMQRSVNVPKLSNMYSSRCMVLRVFVVEDCETNVHLNADCF